MEPPKLEVADIFRHYGEAYRQKFGTVLSTAQRRVMKAIELCRTAALGGHVEVCDRCGHQRIWYNSCSDRHCPKCQSLARAQWGWRTGDRNFSTAPYVLFPVMWRSAMVSRLEALALDFETT